MSRRCLETESDAQVSGLGWKSGRLGLVAGAAGGTEMPAGPARSAPLQGEGDWQLLRAELLDCARPRAGCSAQPGARWGGKQDAAMEPREAQSREGRAMASGAAGVGHPGHPLGPGGRAEGAGRKGE